MDRNGQNKQKRTDMDKNGQKGQFWNINYRHGQQWTEIYKN